MNKIRLFSLTALLAFAISLTLSCSGDGGGGGGNSGGNGEPIKKAKITGVSQKGPFVEGSKATLYELNENFEQTGRSFTDIIADNKGSFEIKSVELISPYAMLEASGYYRNEVTGGLSNGTITLFAIADMREKDNFNVNLLTHLEYYRVLNLVEGGKSVAEAKKQAQKEILAVFGISGDFENSEDMNIFGATEGDAALLAISILLQGNLGEGAFSQRLTNFAQSLKESGKWDNEAAKTAMAEWASMANLEFIKNGILGWGLSDEVPDFGKYATDYWIAAYGLGDCGSSNESEIKKDNRNVYRICRNGNWAVANEFEYDTYQWICSAGNDGEIKKGNVSSIHYICKNKVWQEPSYREQYCFENTCQHFTDSRDNQQYAYAVIGSQTWMAENLNYNISGSKCYNDLDSNCDIYGRLYDWETSLTVCPDDWHLPTKEDWDTMANYIGGENTVGKKLKSRSGWHNNGNGTDDYGFSALPSGYGFSDGSFYDVGGVGRWWGPSEFNSDYAYTQGLGYSSYLAWNNFDKLDSYSVRCLKD